MPLDSPVNMLFITMLTQENKLDHILPAFKCRYVIYVVDIVCGLLQIAQTPKGRLRVCQIQHCL